MTKTRTTEKPRKYPVAIYDAERARVFNVRQKRLYLAIEAVVQGATPSQLCTMFATYAEEVGDDHKLWRVNVQAARKIMNDAMKELQKDLAKDRAKAYATQMARYHHLYRQALKKQDDRQALAVLDRITELQERISGSGSSEQQESRKAGRASETIGKAVEELTRAIARNNNRSRKPTEDASQEPPGTQVS